MGIFRFYIMVSVLVVGCSRNSGQGVGSGELTAKEKQVICNEVEKTLLAYQNDMRDKGLVAEFKYLDSSEDFFWVPPGYHSALNYDSVAKAIRRNNAGYARVNDVFHDLRIVALSHNLATYTCKVKSEVTLVNGLMHDFTLLETGVMIKRGKDWKIHSGQTTLIQE